jgi:predicted transcriptional regulator
MEEARTATVAMTADIVSSYVGTAKLPVEEITQLVRNVYAALNDLGRCAPIHEVQTPAVPISKSITPDFLISLEDGAKYKSLKRHLRTKYNMTPEAYRAKWGLPRDYPMVAPNYAATRSVLAKSLGLGRVGATGEARPKATKAKPRARVTKT